MEALASVRPRVNLQLAAADEETRRSSYVFAMAPKGRERIRPYRMYPGRF
jgi:hypothetical protein